MRKLSIAVSGLVLLIAGVSDAGSPVPSPTPPPYIIFGNIGDYRSFFLDSGEGLGLVAKGRLEGLGGEIHHQIGYGVGQRLTGAEVEVQEVGDTTWLRHELELLLRRPGRHPELREIDGNYLLSPQAEAFYWISGGNKVVLVGGSSSQVPLDESFVSAYLAVLPSDLEPFELNEAHEQQFIRDEIDRRFYYIDKAMERFQAEQNPDRRLPTRAFVNKSLEAIVELREKYFGGPSPRQWLDAQLEDFHRRRPGADLVLFNSEPELRRAIDDLKTWWAAHRNDPVALPTSTPAPQGTPSP